jgi:hypothetical protein
MEFGAGVRRSRSFRFPGSAHAFVLFGCRKERGKPSSTASANDDVTVSRPRSKRTGACVCLFRGRAGAEIGGEAADAR